MGVQVSAAADTALVESVMQQVGRRVVGQEYMVERLLIGLLTGVTDVTAAIVHEDPQLLVINKPAGVAVHGGSGVSFGVIEALRTARPKQWLKNLLVFAAPGAA